MRDRPVLICGGAGFIGTNLAARLLAAGERVIIFDDLSRLGVESNLQWLQQPFPKQLEFELGDVCDRPAVSRIVRGCSAVFNFAAQVAVTTSLLDPLHDFEVNTRGTLNILEELRLMKTPPMFLFTSTNKVYGNLGGLALRQTRNRYEPQHPALLSSGVSEVCPLDFQSPYGCSKGAADQYVLDYARSFQLPSVVFRMSCIYGPHQFGTEDQGWVAHFLLRALNERQIDVYGDGMQVRDVLFVEDLVDAFLAARRNIETVKGNAFNIGGGIASTISLLELIELIAGLHGERPQVEFHDWRIGDQKYYVSDTGKFQKATGWRPRTTVRSGLEQLYHWLMQSTNSAAFHGSAR
jgi:CDP-paratose 2-epimerase